MKNKEITNGNKLIAEFMGRKGKVNAYLYWVNVPSVKWVTIEQMQFHTSWDWLMPVVKKCSESFEHHQYDSEKYYHITEEIFHPDYSLAEFMDADIEAVYSRVVTYIKWYNQNSNNN